MEWLQVWGALGLLALVGAQRNSSIFRPPSTRAPPKNASYLLLVPSEVSVGTGVTMTITILTSDPEVEVKFYLSTMWASFIVSGGSSTLLNLPAVPVAEASRGYFTMTFAGYASGKLLFQDKQRLRLKEPDVNTFIQTDKARYRPGEVVRIRVLSIGADRRPDSSPVDIVIKDPKGYIIRQWLSVNASLGVARQELQLSAFPPLGDWTIQATVRDNQITNQFNVAHYVLPKFKVWISVPSVVFHTDNLTGSVTAKYTHGQPVAGSVVVALRDVGGASTISKTILGSANFEFDMSDGWGTYRRHQAVRVVANVTDALTGLTYSSEVTVDVKRFRYEISFEHLPFVLRPSLSLTLKLKISTYNGQPLTLEDQAKTVWVDVDQIDKYEVPSFELWERGVWDEGAPSANQTTQYPIPPDGVIPLLVHILEDTSRLTIGASLEDTYETLTLDSNYHSPSQSYLQIQKPTTPAQAGLSIQLPIQSNFQASQFFYMVKSRDRIVGSGQGSSPLLLTPETSWAPLACVVVYCVLPSGEVVIDVLQLPVPLKLQNTVSLTWSEEQRSPADQVSLWLTVSEPQSVVSILVVDTATQQQDSRNDITVERVLEELHGGLSEDLHGGGDPEALFRSCDLIVVTDAALYPALPGQVAIAVEVMASAQEGEARPRQRQNFPETWLWMDINTGPSTTAELTVTVPDSITTWSATAFVMSEDLGLGILQSPVELTVFQDFFMSLNLPAFIIRGEELVLKVALYNYLSWDLQVMVTVAQSDAFEFILAEDEELSLPSSHQVIIRNQSGVSVWFPIRPLALGEMPISVTALSSEVGDAIRRSVLVKAEGLEQYFSSSLLVEVPSSGLFLGHLDFFFPADVVAGSERAEVTVVGDLLAPSIQGLESLIQMPYGCGEQNMIHFAPNIYVIQYLDASGQSDPELVARAVQYMESGYERELSYQRTDGSFSAFGESDSSGSTWLSAFVLRCFLQARPYILVDSSVLDHVAGWLSLQQGPDGRYLEPGRVIHTELQGGLDGPASLTAYVLLALLQDDDVKTRFATQVSEALMYLETRLATGISSNYGLCLVTYALALSGSPSAASAWDTLLSRALVTDGVPFWTSSSSGLASSWQPRTADIEMAAYAVLTLEALGERTDALAIIMWLSQQRNHLGGYGSTQDTVVALQALTSYSLTSAPDLSITVASGTSTTSFSVDLNNYVVVQRQQIDAAGGVDLQVEASGAGMALVELHVFYNIQSSPPDRRRRREADVQEAFLLDVQLFDRGAESANLSICTRLAEDQELEETGMAILEVGLLSGLVLAQEGVPTDRNVMRVETEDGKVIVYLASVSRAELCVEIPLMEEFVVARVQHAFVITYDYYEPSRRTVRSYTSASRQEKDYSQLCEDGMCGGQATAMSTATPAAHTHLLALLVCPLLATLACCV